VRDPLGNRIGEDVARVAARASPGSVFGVVDPFAGSCNGLFWILRHLPGAEGLGFEFERAIFDMSARNIASLRASIKLVYGDYGKLLGQHHFPGAHHIVAFLAPPWADALSAEGGLDLGFVPNRQSRTSLMSLNASIRTTRSFTSRKCMSVSYLNLSPLYVPDSSGRHLTSMTFPDLRDDTGYCSAPSVGRVRNDGLSRPSAPSGHHSTERSSGAGLRQVSWPFA
jgi:hypothetical protein